VVFPIESVFAQRFITMNTMRYLGGDAIIEASNGNNTHAEEKLAHALAVDKASLTGTLLCIALCQKMGLGASRNEYGSFSTSLPTHRFSPCTRPLPRPYMPLLLLQQSVNVFAAYCSEEPYVP
jgi:hypothetical protein